MIAPFRNAEGFTLIELLVSVGIFTLITTMAVWNHARFNGTVILTNLAYEVALSLREAQTYGITVKQSTAGTFDSGYGVHFESADPTSYVLFEDKSPQNHIFDAGEELERFSISKGNGIRRLCVESSCGLSTVDVSFVRPNPDAYIKGSGLSTAGSDASLCVSAPDGTVRIVEVESTGQISVHADDNAICSL